MIRHTAQRDYPAATGKPRRLRAGYSLIEALVSVAIIAMVMTAAAVAMQTMYRVDRQLKDNIAYGQVMPRLSLQLRTDVHAATDVSLLIGPNGADGLSLTLAASDEVVEYHSEARRIVRTWRRDGKELGREVYYLGKTATFRWQTTSVPAPMVELEIVRVRGKIDSADSRQVDRVVAAIGIRVPRKKEGVADASNE